MATTGLQMPANSFSVIVQRKSNCIGNIGHSISKVFAFPITQKTWSHRLAEVTSSNTNAAKWPLKVGSEVLQFPTDAEQVKMDLKNSLQGLNRGIFGVRSETKAEIERLLELLEEKNPVPNPTDNIYLMDGQWRLLYSSVTILGSKRTKLGLREFVRLGDILQTISAREGKAQNTVQFSVAGLGMFSGELTIDASFQIASSKRVNIKYEKSSITPEKLFNIFEKNYDLLLSIFNPEGWLEITYVDTSSRICRDDKGYVYFLEKD